MTKKTESSGDEASRLKALQGLHILDTPAEAAFDELTKLASKVCQKPIALISFVDDHRQWFKSNIGLENVSETPKEVAFCAHSILSENILEVPDATKDERFKDNPLVTGSPDIRFYAGAPITLPDGENVGTLCVIDQQASKLTAEQKTLLQGLANVASKMLATRADMLHIIEDKTQLIASVISSSNDAIVTKSLDGKVTSWNKGAEQLFGYSEQEMIGQPITKLYPKDSTQDEIDFYKQVTNDKAGKRKETIRIKKNNELVHVSVSLSPVFNHQREVVGISKIARNITKEKTLQLQIQKEHEYRRVMMDSIHDGLISTDIHGNIEYLNPFAEKITGWSQEEAKGQPILKVFNIIDNESRKPCINLLGIAIAENRTISTSKGALLINKQGHEFPIEDSAAPITNEENKVLGAILVFRDVSKQQFLMNEMAYRATHDSLTGALNRHEFEQRLGSALAFCKGQTNITHVLMYINLDQFKIVNDTSGHSAGDALLAEISKVISSAIRSTDILARLGGDEFGVLLEKCSADSALGIAEKIRKSVDSFRFNVGKRRFHVGASIGLVSIDFNAEHIDILLKAAAQACQIAKRKGRNRVNLYFDNDNAIKLHQSHMKWASQVEQAIDENKFTLFCQRIIPLNKQSNISGEILLRMIDEETGDLISPGLFLPAAERYNMAFRIDRWVIQKTFDWIEANQDAIDHIDEFSINLSGQSIGDNSFLAYMNQLLTNITFAPNKICFEITETAAISSVESASAFISSMKKHAIKFSLDDFGSGLSSFGYLKSLDVDYIKIDGQFIKELTQSRVDQATVRCLVEVAKETEKETIAEWVEDEATENMLKEMGVHYSQGYFRHKPAPIKEMLIAKQDSSNAKLSA